jgi:uncharacterized RDD family membrane protein YckC
MQPFRRRISAAQSEPVLRICPQCGSVNPEHVTTCPFCEAPLGTPEEAAKKEIAEPSTEPAWRLEVARKLRDYRARRGVRRANESQGKLPFLAKLDEPEPEEGFPAAAARTRKPQRVEITIAQPELDFSSRGDNRSRPGTRLFPVAELGRRCCAGVLDMLFLVLSYAGFLALFRWLGGEIVLGKLDLLVYAAAFFLFYAQYFVLFTAFNGPTPGMQLLRLSVVGFEGNAPRPEQLLWRSFGYVIAGGAAWLGFLWALWDEDHLTWQDRVSQTYITAMPAPAEPNPAERQTAPGKS